MFYCPNPYIYSIMINSKGFKKRIDCFKKLFALCLSVRTLYLPYNEAVQIYTSNIYDNVKVNT